jgi:hypothetical protein
MQDRFGESGAPSELLEHFELTAPHIAAQARMLLRMKSRTAGARVPDQESAAIPNVR